MLIRAARDHVESNPAFATKAAFLALRWMAEGYGYEITSGDAIAAHGHLMDAARSIGLEEETRAGVRRLLEPENAWTAFLRRCIGPQIG